MASVLEDGGGVEADEEANVCYIEFNLLPDLAIQQLITYSCIEESITKEIIP